MPRYELLLITKALAHPQLKKVLHRTATNLIDQGAIIRKIESLGQQELPSRMRAHSLWHTHGNYFIFDTYLKKDSLAFINKELFYDSDVIKKTLIKKDFFDGIPKKVPEIFECTTSYTPPNLPRKQFKSQQ